MSQCLESSKSNMKTLEKASNPHLSCYKLWKSFTTIENLNFELQLILMKILHCELKNYMLVFVMCRDST